MIVKLLTEHHLEFLRLKGGCRGSSESTLAKLSNCWKSHAAAHFIKLWIWDHKWPNQMSSGAWPVSIKYIDLKPFKRH